MFLKEKLAEEGLPKPEEGRANAKGWMYSACYIEFLRVGSSVWLKYPAKFHVTSSNLFHSMAEPYDDDMLSYWLNLF